LHKTGNYQRVRKISKMPCKVLDAPALQDDFYLNLIDWSSANQLAVGLGNCIYLWNADTSKVTKLCELQNDLVTSVGWAASANLLAVGCNRGEVQLWDINEAKQIRKMCGHEIRVGAIAWSSSQLATGSRDKSVLLRDVRARRDFSFKLGEHSQEICGLKWSLDEQYLASGGNDNKVAVWSAGGQLLNKFTDHRAAVKALAWSPQQHGLLATGGGTADRMLRLRNVFTSQIVFEKDTGSQICNLAFSRSTHEIVSTHGYSQNEINIWSYPRIKKVATLIGHTHRVLYLAMSPDGSTVVTGAGDETLRFWSVFPSGGGAGQLQREDKFGEGMNLR
jgi:cell division cycle 20-like protein 1 (cofactor of APC complex)